MEPTLLMLTTRTTIATALQAQHRLTLRGAGRRRVRAPRPGQTVRRGDHGAR